MRISTRTAIGTLTVLAAVGILAASAFGATVSVPATGSGSNFYVDSGINIPTGASATVSSSGTWAVCAYNLPLCTSGPAGNSNFPASPVYNDPAASPGTLIGSTDGGATWFAIGAGPTVVSGPGELLLAANDWQPALVPFYYADNSGSASTVITVSPTSKDACKKSGWQALTGADGAAFKNQGDCVSYVATGGTNNASG